ncbi:hypothetical protein QQ045_027805 [Rhodiola kirilowii]
MKSPTTALGKWKIQVTAVKWNSWREVELLCPSSSIPHNMVHAPVRLHPVTVQGDIYWIGKIRSDNSRHILKFSLAEETLTTLPLPEEVSNKLSTQIPNLELEKEGISGRQWRVQLGHQNNKSLFLYHYNTYPRCSLGSDVVEVWLYSNDAWMKVLSISETSISEIPYLHNIRPLGFLANGDFVLTCCNERILVESSSADVPSQDFNGEHDPELRIVLELATDAELYELERILFGPSYFSPLLKSIASRVDSEYVAIGEDLEERECLISLLESRFLFLAADARATLRGWRPSYRAALLAVRKKLKIPCSSKLSTEDLEIEIFLHLLRDYSSEESENFLSSNENMKSSSAGGGLELGLSQWKVLTSAAFKVGGAELKSMFFKGGTMFTLGKIYQLLSRRLSGKLFLEAANYQMKNTMINKGGQFAVASLESRAALLAAKQGFAGAATSYLGLRTMVYFLGPVMWGTLLADVVIQMLGTDYARILRAIYAFAQVGYYAKKD